MKPKVKEGEDEKKDDKKEGDDKKADKKKGAKKSKKGVNQYANWWEDESGDSGKKEIVDSTPDYIKDHDVYQDMIARFMPENFKDKAL